MDIRTKLVFTLVAVSLTSMLVLGAFAYRLSVGLLQAHALRQLEAVAESKKGSLAKVLDAWRDRANLIASRTQLRLSLRDLELDSHSAELARIRRILGDAHGAVPTVRGIVVFDAAGTPVAWTGERPSPDSADIKLFGDPEAMTAYRGVRPAEDGTLEVTYLAPLRLESDLIGALEVRMDAHELIEVSADYTGLGDSGETLIAHLGPDGRAAILNPVRHVGGGQGPALDFGASDPVDRALSGDEGAHSDASIDHRGEEVWAATRTLSEPGWGLVVQVDKAEEMQVAQQLRRTLVKLGVSLSAFAIVIGTLLGLYFARPLRELADVAHRIRHGEFDLRANVRSDDEVGELARTFNKMIEVLVTSHRELEIRIGDRDPDSKTRAEKRTGRASS